MEDCLDAEPAGDEKRPVRAKTPLSLNVTVPEHARRRRVDHVDGLIDSRPRYADPGEKNNVLEAHSARFYGMRRYEMTQFQCALTGAGMASSLALFVGAVGNTLGVFEENSTWYLVGAAAAAGAYLGGTVGADNLNYRVRYRWEPDNR